MPLTVAPPPRKGEAAQGPWYADPPSISATDHAPVPSDEPATEPAHPQPVAAARTAATGDFPASAAPGSSALWTAPAAVTGGTDAFSAPHTVAHTAATGDLSAPPAATTSDVSAPLSATRTAATAAFFATVAPLLAAIAVAFVAAIRLALSGHERLTFGGVPSVLLALGFGITTAAALVAATRAWTAPRPGTLILAVAVSVAWPLSGVAIPAAVLATAVIALALFYDARVPGGARIVGVAAPTVLLLWGMVMTVMGVATAGTHTAPPPPREATAAITAVPAEDAAARAAADDRAARNAAAAAETAANDKAAGSLKTPPKEDASGKSADGNAGADGKGDAAGADAGSESANGAAGGDASGNTADGTSGGGATGDTASGTSGSTATGGTNGGSATADTPSGTSGNGTSGGSATGDTPSGTGGGTSGGGATHSPAPARAVARDLRPRLLPAPRRGRLRLRLGRALARCARRARAVRPLEGRLRDHAQQPAGATRDDRRGDDNRDPPAGGARRGLCRAALPGHVADAGQCGDVDRHRSDGGCPRSASVLMASTLVAGRSSY